MTLPPESWLHATQRLLREAGRARIHDLRDGLNVAALGTELLVDASSLDTDGRPGIDRAAGSVRRGVAAVGQEVDGLHALVVEITEPAARTFADATEWAITATRPVARRRGLDVALPRPLDGLGQARVPDGLSILLALVFVEAFLEAPRRSGCSLEIRERGQTAPGLTLGWTVAADADLTLAARACTMLTSLVDAGGRVALQTAAGSRRLQCEWFRPSPARGPARS